MTRLKFTPAETKMIEEIIEGARVALVNPMCGGSIAIEARASRPEVEAVAATLGLVVLWDVTGPYGALQRAEVAS